MQLKDKPYSVLQNCCEEEEVLQYAVQDRNIIRKQLGLQSDDFAVLCPGSIEHRKGPDLLLDLLPVLEKKISTLRVVFIGDPSTPWGHDLVDRMVSGCFGGKVTYVPARPTIMDFLHAADLLVFPSRAEALPRTILEAMVMKTPVIASDVDGITELIVDGKTGLIFPNEDTGCLLSAILKFYTNSELKKELNEAAALRYWEHFSRKCQFDRMKDVLRDIYANF